jgi:hypothetical protein
VEEPDHHHLNGQRRAYPLQRRRMILRRRKPFRNLSETKEMAIKSSGALVGVALAGLVAAGVPGAGAAEALVSQGIGASSCARLADDINPAEGLSNPINVMLFAWVQGYVSAANVALLEDDARHIDMGTIDDAKVLNLVQSFCKANPDKKPVTAIDEMIRKSAKLKTKWEPGTIEWDE